MDYYVHVDLYDAVGPAVHKAGCRLVRNRRPNASTLRWDGPFTFREVRRATDGRIRHQPARATPPCCGGLGPAPT